MNPTYHPVDVVTFGDSVPTFAFHAGQTIPVLKVITQFFGYSPFVFLDCPEGAASGYNPASPYNGWYITDTEQIDGKKGYTPDGVLWDRISERFDPDDAGWVRHEFALAGTTAYETVGSYGVWADGIPPSGVAGYSGMWASTDQHGCVLAELIADPPTGRCSIVGMVGGNDFLIRGHTGGDFTIDPPRPDTALDVAGKLEAALDEIGDWIQRLNPGAEVVLISYPNFPLDDPDRQAALATRGIGPTPPYGYHLDVPDDEYTGSYLAPSELTGIPFPPPNEFSPGFYQEVWAGIHLVQQWVIEDSQHRRPWYDHWWADNNWASFVSIFNPTPAAAWAAAAAYSNTFLSQFHSVDYRAAFGTANFRSDRFNPYVQMAIDGGHQPAESARRATGQAWTYIRGWDSLPAASGTGPAYPTGDKHLWFDGIHLKEAGAIPWIDHLLDRWLPATIHRRRAVELSAPRPPVTLSSERPSAALAAPRPAPAIVARRFATALAWARSRNRLSATRCSTNFFGPAVEAPVSLFRALGDVDWTQFDPDDLALYDQLSDRIIGVALQAGTGVTIQRTGEVLELGTALDAADIAFDPAPIGMISTDVQAAIVETIQGVPTLEYVLDSSAPSNSRNTFNNWPDLYAVLGRFGGRKIVRLRQPEAIDLTGMPVGGWDFDFINFAGTFNDPTQGGAYISFADGTLIASWYAARLTEGATLHFQNGTIPVFTVPAFAQQVVALSESACIVNTGAAPVFSVRDAGLAFGLTLEGRLHGRATGVMDYTSVFGPTTEIVEIDASDTPAPMIFGYVALSHASGVTRVGDGWLRTIDGTTVPQLIELTSTPSIINTPQANPAATVQYLELSTMRSDLIGFNPAGTTLSQVKVQQAIVEICQKLDAAGIAGF